MYDIICEYVGILECKGYTSENQSQYVACIGETKFGLGVDSLKGGNEARFINSYKGLKDFPNVDLKVSVCIMH